MKNSIVKSAFEAFNSFAIRIGNTFGGIRCQKIKLNQHSAFNATNMQNHIHSPMPFTQILDFWIIFYRFDVFAYATSDTPLFDNRTDTGSWYAIPHIWCHLAFIKIVLSYWTDCDFWCSANVCYQANRRTINNHETSISIRNKPMKFFAYRSKLYLACRVVVFDLCSSTCQTKQGFQLTWSWAALSFL